MSPENRPRLPKVATVHEKTVQEAAERAAERPRGRRRRRGPPAGRIAAQMTYQRVRRDVWEEALRRASHPSHIQIVNEEEVIVWNHGPPWPTMPGTTPEPGAG